MFSANWRGWLGLFWQWYLTFMVFFFFFELVNQVLKGMVERGKGTILFTGCSASVNAIPGYSQICKWTSINWFVCLFVCSLFHQIQWFWWIELMNVGTGCGKFALRALAQCLAKEFQPQGVHIAHVIIDGVVAPPRFILVVHRLIDSDSSPNFPNATMIH